MRRITVQTFSTIQENSSLYGESVEDKETLMDNILKGYVLLRKSRSTVWSRISPSSSLTTRRRVTSLWIFPTIYHNFFHPIFLLGQVSSYVLWGHAPRVCRKFGYITTIVTTLLLSFEAITLHLPLWLLYHLDYFPTHVTLLHRLLNRLTNAILIHASR